MTKNIAMGGEFKRMRERKLRIDICGDPISDEGLQPVGSNKILATAQNREIGRQSCFRKMAL